MKNFFLSIIILTALAASVSCERQADVEPVGDEPAEMTEMTFFASSDDVSRTSLNGDFEVLWSAGDDISVFSGSTWQSSHEKFTLTSLSSGGRKAVFEGLAYKTGTYYSVYPYSTSNSFSSRNRTLTVNLSGEQTAVAGSFADKTNISVSVSSDEEFMFRNVCALVGLEVGNDDVSKITLRTLSEKEYVCGRATVRFSGTEPSVTVSSYNSSGSIVMTGDFRKGQKYYFVVYPGTYSGFVLTYEFADGTSMTRSNSNSCTLARGTVCDCGTITMEQTSAPVLNEWEKLADLCTSALIENFMNKSAGYFYGTPADMLNDSQYLYWQQAHALDVLVYSYERIKDYDPTRAALYETYFRRWFDNDAHNYNNSKDNEGDYGGFFNSYTDDMCWICLTMLHLTEAVGSTVYADTAKEIYDRYIIPRAYTDAKGTGLPWTDMEGNMGRNACTNAPGCLVAAKLYQRYGESKYLDDAVTLYEWLYGCMERDLGMDGRVEEPPLTYTQGTFGEACRQLYHITGKSAYMDMAAKVLVYGMTSGRCTSSAGVLRHEGTSMDQSIFKAVLIPYAVNFVLDASAPAASARTIRERLELNAETLKAHLDTDSYPEMFVSYYWGDDFSESVASMGAQTSGASLLENFARL